MYFLFHLGSAPRTSKRYIIMRVELLLNIGLDNEVDLLNLINYFVANSTMKTGNGLNLSKQ